MAWKRFADHDCLASQDAFMMPMNAVGAADEQLEQAKELASGVRFGGFAVWKKNGQAKAWFRNSMPADLQENRHRTPTCDLYVATALDDGHVAEGALARPAFIDYKESEEWAELPLCITAPSAASRLCLTVVWKAKGANPIRGKFRVALIRHGGAVVWQEVICAGQSNVWLNDPRDLSVDIQEGDKLRFHVSTGNHLEPPRGRRSRTVKVKELKCVLWPVPPSGVDLKRSRSKSSSTGGPVNKRANVKTCP
eukprot:TRINITY_DN28010_c0_g1_i1.p1 TRINITY_DN28010_c0_g1~~TRINITY_DN28010_c0_g1_i1.p1  ORF type:complete len:274 (-),score=33.61 TRINITY_DN28010_c0_g1_i1:126-878(-)